MTSACIHHRVTGKSNFLDIAIKNADYLYSVFQPRPKSLVHFGFNPSQIMGLTELYRETQNPKYLELAGIFIDMRGSTPEKPWQAMDVPPTVPYFFIGDQCQMRTPLRKASRAVGHAVLGMYLWSGAADVCAETGEKAVGDALRRIWTDVTQHKMYITGAVGQTHHGASGRYDMVHEAFLEEYMMPNATAYNETCANIANAMFSYRMLALDGRSRYADTMELVLYNSALSGISTDGKHYFYANPLRMNLGTRDYSSTESETREPYLDCFCCPPNLVRTIAKCAGWAYSLSERGIAVNLYGGNRLNTRLRDGSTLELEQTTRYPWDGQITITIGQCRNTPMEILLRIPGWADTAQILVNGKPADVAAKPGTYARLVRAWKTGDELRLQLPLDIKRMEGNPRIEELRNQVALQRGPVVYCIESADLPAGADILNVYLPESSPLTAEHHADLLGGVTTIHGDVALRQDANEGMYRAVKNPHWKTITTQFVPYFAWCNRGANAMTVFLPVIWGNLR